MHSGSMRGDWVAAAQTPASGGKCPQNRGAPRASVSASSNAPSRPPFRAHTSEICQVTRPASCALCTCTCCCTRWPSSPFFTLHFHTALCTPWNLPGNGGRSASQDHRFFLPGHDSINSIMSGFRPVAAHKTIFQLLACAASVFKCFPV